MFPLRPGIRPGKRIVKRPYTILTCLLLLSSVVTMSRSAVADVDDANVNSSTLLVNAYQGRSIARSGTGYVIAVKDKEGVVITSGQLVKDADHITVDRPGDGAEMVARRLATDDSMNIAVLAVVGLSRNPLTFAAKPPAPGDTVWTAVRWNKNSSVASLVRGRMKRAAQPAGQSLGYLFHDASAGAGTAGSLLLNNCGQVAGFSPESAGPNGEIRSLDGATLSRMLKRFRIEVAVAAKPCVSAVDQAQQQAMLAANEAKNASQDAAHAQQVAQTLEKRLQASNKNNEALVAETRAAKQRADEAMKRAEIAHDNVETARAELEKKTATIVAQTQAMIKFLENDNARAEARFQAALREQHELAAVRERWLTGIGVALILAFMAFTYLRGRGGATTRTPEPASVSPPAASGRVGTELHRQELTEYVLDGRDEDGIRYLLRISGDQLSTPDGVVIGRNPQDSPYIINHADVSRKHARMKVMKNRVFIEDLGSTNGTSVNGQSIDDRGPVSVVNGDQIIIGSVVMKLRVLGA